MPSRPPVTVKPLMMISFPRLYSACGDAAWPPGCCIVVFFWPSSVIPTMWGAMLTCSLQVPLTSTGVARPDVRQGAIDRIACVAIDRHGCGGGERCRKTQDCQQGGPAGFDANGC